MKLNKDEAESIVTSTFLLEQELSRGKWDIEREAAELISFAKTFEKKVDAFVSGEEQ